jgi:hypothetical protein
VVRRVILRGRSCWTGEPPLVGGAGAVLVELLATLQVRWDRDAGRWFALLLQRVPSSASTAAGLAADIGLAGRVSEHASSEAQLIDLQLG